MNISSNRVLVERIEPPAKDGFQSIMAQDSFTYQGRVTLLPEHPIHVDNRLVATGDTILFAKYSPDTHELEIDGKKLKFVKQEDILAVL